MSTNSPAASVERMWRATGCHIQSRERLTGDMSSEKTPKKSDYTCGSEHLALVDIALSGNARKCRANARKCPGQTPEWMKCPVFNNANCGALLCTRLELVTHSSMSLHRAGGRRVQIVCSLVFQRTEETQQKTSGEFWIESVRHMMNRGVLKSSCCNYNQRADGCFRYNVKLSHLTKDITTTAFASSTSSIQ